VYKKYIWVNGKRYGPYLYHNKRVGDKIVTSYHGSNSEKADGKSFLPYVLMGVLISVFVLSSGFFIFSSPYGDLFLAPPEEGAIEIDPAIVEDGEPSEYGAILNEPIEWVESFSVSEVGEIIIEIPASAWEIKVDKIDSSGNKERVRDDEAGDNDARDEEGGEEVIEEGDEGNESIGNESIVGNETEGNETNVSLAPPFFSPEVPDSRFVVESVERESEGGTTLEVPVTVREGDSLVEIIYTTPAPTSEETRIEKGINVRVIGDDSVHVENVLVYADFPEELDVRDSGRVGVYWEEASEWISPESVEDTDGDRIIDYVEFVAPHLSEQNFRVILITEAEHLDSSRSFVSDIYDEVRELDDVWSETIPSGDYVRVTFESELTSSNDITVYPRIVSGDPRIAVYEKDGTDLIVEFESLEEEENVVYLDNLVGSQDTFDLLVLDGDVEFDYITDPGTLPTMLTAATDKQYYAPGETVTFTVTWSQGADTDDVSLFIDDDFDFNNCDLNDQSGCVTFSAPDSDSPTEATMLARSQVIWYAQICDVDGCDKGIISDVSGSGGSLSTADTILTGVDADDLSGTSISSGDFDGDGFDDVLIGAFQADQGGSEQGEVYIVYGSNTLPATIDLETGEDATLIGYAPGRRSGTSVASGDFNSDGIDDLLIGAPGSVFQDGWAYLIYGDSFRLQDDSLANADIEFDGSSFGNLGNSLTSGDFDGDGFYDHAVLAAHNYRVALDFFGKVYVDDGANFPSPPGNIDINILADYSFTGLVDGDDIGDSVASGDFDNDTYDDLLIGAVNRGASGQGGVYVVYGNPLTSGLGGEVEISGTVASGFVGSSVAAGDFDGDSVEDILIGASGEDKVYLFYGAHGTELISTTTASADVVFNGGAGDQAGVSVAAGDFDGDGIDDVVIGADQAGSAAGETYVIYSSGALPFGSSIDLSDVGGSVSGAVFTGITAGDESGKMVTGGDFNGDGVDEVWIGAPSRDDGGDNAVGETYLIRTKENAAKGRFSVLELKGVDYVPQGSDTYNEGDSVTIRGVWTSGEVANYKFLIDDSLDFMDCDFTTTSGCLGFAATSSLSTSATISSVTSNTKWFARVCDSNGVCDDLLETDLGKGGSLSTEADLLLTGIDASDQSGFSVGSGDVNGDSYEDLLIGANRADNPSTQEGEVYLVYGNDSFPSSVGLDQIGDVSAGDAMDGMLLTGYFASGEAGSDVDTGDYDLDGFYDIIIGAEDPAGFIGEVYVIQGGDSLPTSVDLGNSGNVTLDYAAFGSVGKSVSSGNFTGNGYDDFLIGGTFLGAGFEGGAFMVEGSSSLASHTLGTGTDVTYSGVAGGDSAGAKVASGDFDNDGMADMLIGAPDSSSSNGAAYLVYGSTSLTDITLSSADAVFSGSGGERAGDDVAAGDFNNDGFDDVAIGAGSGSKVYVIYGGAGGSKITGSITLSSGSDVEITGGSGDQAGTGLYSGDFNGDGVDDLLIGARNANSNAGESYILYGGTWSATIDLTTESDVTLSGIDSNDFSGFDVVSADFDYDGIDDALISAYAADNGVGGEGESYLVQLARNDATGIFKVLPSIAFDDTVTPANGATVPPTFPIKVDITEDDLKNVTFNWNGQDYVMYSDSHRLLFNFDNVAALGEDLNTVKDASRYGNNGTTNGGMTHLPVGGRYGGAYDYVGPLTSQHISIPDSPSLRTTEGITISAWVTLDSVGAPHLAITAKRRGSDLSLLLKNDNIMGDIGFCLASSHCLTSFDVGSRFVGPGIWNHVVGTWDGTTMKLYRDGVEDSATYSGFSGPIQYDSNDLLIGAQDLVGGMANFWNGAIDEVMILDRALSATEVNQLYFSNLYKYDIDKWSLLVSQSKDSTSGLDPGAYTYQSTATSNTPTFASTEVRSATVASATAPTIEAVYDVIDNDGGASGNEVQALTGTVNNMEVRFLLEDINGIQDLPGGTEAIDQSAFVGELNTGNSNMEVFARSSGVEHTSIDALSNALSCQRLAGCPSDPPCILNQMEYSCTIPMEYYYEPGSVAGGDFYRLFVRVEDPGDLRATDQTRQFDYLPVAGVDFFVIDNGLTWTSIDRSATDQVADGSVGLINRGNVDFVSGTIQGSDLTPDSGQGGDDIPVTTFSISVQSGGVPPAQCDGGVTADELTSSSQTIDQGGPVDLVYGDAANTGGPPPTPPTYNEEIYFCLWEQLDSIGGLNLIQGDFSVETDNCPGALPANCVPGTVGHPWELILGT